MPSFPLTPAIVYGGLGLCLLGLVVAALLQRWKARTFFLCALRVAIGWHFLFEGLHKIHSMSVGPTETNKPFSSEMFHATAEGPAGPLVRKYFLDDTAALTAERLTPPPSGTPIPAPNVFATLSNSQQAALCPPKVAAELAEAAAKGKGDLDNALSKAKEARDKAVKDTDVAKPRAEAEAAKKAAGEAAAAAGKAETEAEELSAAAVIAKGKDEKEWQAAKEKASAARAKAREARRAAAEAQTRADAAEKKAADAKKKVDDAEAAAKAADAKLKIGDNDAEALKAAYAAWVCGTDGRDAKVKFVSSDVPQTVPQRKKHIELMKKELDELTARQEIGLGNGYSHELTRTKTLKADIRTAETDLLKDADSLVDDLKKAAGWKPDPAAAKPERAIDKLDRYTSWAITAMGACLLLGLFTRLNCLAAAGFLIMTVLEHPTVPWLPLPPNTEGNPLFINKNVIEALALLAVATFPTGRWFGLDAIIYYVFCSKRKSR